MQTPTFAHFLIFWCRCCNLPNGRVHTTLSRRLITKADFARHVGIKPTSVRYLVNHGLAVAIVGGKIDMNHSAVIKYIDGRDNPDKRFSGSHDDRYGEAVIACNIAQRCSVLFLKKQLNMGGPRAKRIIQAILENKDFPKKIAPPPPPSLLTPFAKVAPPPPIAELPTTTPATRKALSLEQKNVTEETYNQIPDNIRAFVDYTLRALIEKFGNDIAFTDWLKATKLIEDIEALRLKNSKVAKELVSIELITIGIFDPINAAYRSLLADGSKTIAHNLFNMGKSRCDLREFEIEVENILKSQIKSAKEKMQRCLTNATK